LYGAAAHPAAVVDTADTEGDQITAQLAIRHGHGIGGGFENSEKHPVLLTFNFSNSC
jgi:hypothetical protein